MRLGAPAKVEQADDTGRVAPSFAGSHLSSTRTRFRGTSGPRRMRGREAPPLARFILRRVALGLLTLILLSMTVFALAQVLPGDVGRQVLGQYATQQQVDLLNHKLGVDRPIPSQYASWVWKLLHGDMGESLQYQVPVWQLLRPALINSLKLAAEAFIIFAPLGILGGVLAALRRGRLTDRVITVGGLSLTAVPEFVSAIVLIVVFGLLFRWLPVTATSPRGASLGTQMKHLLLPSLAITTVLFGYVARMARTGMISALDADYTRTATLEGLSMAKVTRVHVLRNALQPTIAVVATQTGGLLGSLLVIEKLFNYNGLGQRIYTAAQFKDFTMLEAAVLIVGVGYLVTTLIADICYALLNPRIRYRAAE
jgi:peptide/nickel transport system permease protein